MILIVGKDLEIRYFVWIDILSRNELSWILIYSFYRDFLVLLHSELIVQESGVSIYLQISLCASYPISLTHKGNPVFLCRPDAPIIIAIKEALKNGETECPQYGLTGIEQIVCNLERWVAFLTIISRAIGTFFWNAERKSLFWMSCIWRWFLYTKIRLLAFLCEKCWIRKNFCRNMGKL